MGLFQAAAVVRWLSEAAMRLSGDRIWAVYLLSQICVALAFAGAWLLGRRVLGDDRRALIGALLLEGVYYYGVPTPEFNPLILQMALWGMLGRVGHRALTEGRWHDWILLGLLAGLDILTRYSSGLMLASLGLFVLLHLQARRHLLRFGPYVALFVAAMIVMPHVQWLIEEGYPSITYIGERAPRPVDGAAQLVMAAKFLGAQAAALLPAAALFILALWPFRRNLRHREGGGDGVAVAGDARISSFDRAFVVTVALGPVALAVAMSGALGFGLRSMWWRAQMWGFIGVLAMVVVGSRPIGHLALRRFFWGWSLVAGVMLVIFAAIHMLQPTLIDRKKRTAFPGRDLARMITAEWRAKT